MGSTKFYISDGEKGRRYVHIICNLSSLVTQVLLWILQMFVNQPIDLMDELG